MRRFLQRVQAACGRRSAATGSGLDGQSGAAGRGAARGSSRTSGRPSRRLGSGAQPSWRKPRSGWARRSAFPCGSASGRAGRTQISRKGIERSGTFCGYRRSGPRLFSPRPPRCYLTTSASLWNRPGAVGDRHGAVAPAVGLGGAPGDAGGPQPPARSGGRGTRPGLPLGGLLLARHPAPTLRRGR